MVVKLWSVKPSWPLALGYDKI